MALLKKYPTFSGGWIFRQALILNQQVAAKIEKAEPVTAPGVPKHYPDAKKLVTGDCIRPLARAREAA